LAASVALACQAFAPAALSSRVVLSAHSRSSGVLQSTAAEPAAAAAAAADTPAGPPPLDPPTSAELKSETGADFLPLANALYAGDFKEADQLTRDLLIFIAGPGARGRKYVYWSEVQFIPTTDLATLEALWLKYSRGKFGYSVQRRAFDVSAKGDFEAFCRKIDWNLMDDGLERKRRWFGADEFVYDLEAATPGHLPLTSALRGVQLIKALLKHPAWDLPQFADSGKGKYEKKSV